MASYYPSGTEFRHTGCSAGQSKFLVTWTQPHSTASIIASQTTHITRGGSSISAEMCPALTVLVLSLCTRIHRPQRRIPGFLAQSIAAKALTLFRARQALLKLNSPYLILMSLRSENGEFQIRQGLPLCLLVLAADDDAERYTPAYSSSISRWCILPPNRLIRINPNNCTVPIVSRIGK
ncbi:hypothetical protein BDW59DRAFT_144079 [Aspergillus cavernicola]|uniref:Uncharacterized protein n=1 Tax=Aspergillus cavernicola TaxID=176166 RepID=A0ABR4IIM9_9EURO